MSPTGKRTPEEAARGAVAERFVHVVGVVVRGDQAIVAQLMNDVPPHEVDTVVCFREPDGSWVGGSSGNSAGGYVPTGEGVATFLTWAQAPEGARAARFAYGDQEQVVRAERGCVVAIFDDVAQDDLPFDGPRLKAWVDVSGVEQPVRQYEIPEHMRARFRAFVERGASGDGVEGYSTGHE
jgi:hypothetical protein